MPRIRKRKVTGRTCWYAPNIDDNQATRDFEVLIEPMSGREYQDNIEAQARIAEDEESTGKIFRARDRTLEKRIKSVRGYVVSDGETEREVTDPSAFIEAVYHCEDAGELALLDDILAAITKNSHLDKGLKKKSSPAQGSTPEPGPTKPSGSGVAPIAGASSLPSRSVLNHGGGVTGVAEWNRPAMMSPESSPAGSGSPGIPTSDLAHGGS